MRLTRHATVLALLAATAAVPATAAPRCAPPVVTIGRQSASKTPTFPSSNGSSNSTSIVAAVPADPMLAADPRDANLVYLANADTVLRSTDGGCHWAQVFHLPHLSPTTATASAETDRLVSIAAGPGTVYVTTTPYYRGLPHSPVHVFVGSDRGSRFAESTGGLLPLPGVALVAPAPGDARVAYLSVSYGDSGLVASVSPGLKVLYRTDDAGKSWTLVNSGAQTPDPRGCCLVDRRDPKALWVTSAGRATGPLGAYSTDGGATFTDVPAPKRDGCAYTLVDVQPRGGAKPRLLAREECNGTRVTRTYVVADDGATFHALKPMPTGVSLPWQVSGALLGPTADGAFGARPGAFVVLLSKTVPSGTQTHLYAYDPSRPRPWTQLTNLGEHAGDANVSSRGATLVAVSGPRQVVRELAAVSVEFMLQSYVVTYRGAV